MYPARIAGQQQSVLVIRAGLKGGTSPLRPAASPPHADPHNDNERDRHRQVPTVLQQPKSNDQRASGDERMTVPKRLPRLRVVHCADDTDAAARRTWLIAIAWSD